MATYWDFKLLPFPNLVASNRPPALLPWWAVPVGAVLVGGMIYMAVKK